MELFDCFSQSLFNYNTSLKYLNLKEPIVMFCKFNQVVAYSANNTENILCNIKFCYGVGAILQKFKIW